MMPAEEVHGEAPALHKRERVFLLYHELQPEENVYSYAMATGLFAAHLKLFARLSTGAPSAYLPEITFDDGHRSNYEYALPLLDELGLRATFFITAGWTGLKSAYMGWQEVRALQAAGHAIGAHGWTHQLLTHCSEDQLREELRRSRLTLEDRLGVSITSMSLPGGRSNARVRRACREHGYTRIFTSEPRAEADPRSEHSGRLNLHGSRTVEWLEKVLDPRSGSLRALRLQYQVKSALQAIVGDRFYAKAWAVMNRQQRAAEDREAESG